VDGISAIPLSSPQANVVGPSSVPSQQTLAQATTAASTMVRSGALTVSGARRLGPVGWSHDGCCHLFDVYACDDVPTFDEGMIRRALLRGSLACKKMEGLGQTINRQLWEIGYMATLRSDPVDSSIVVEVSKSH